MSPGSTPIVQLLVVDDEEVVRRTLQRAVIRAGYGCVAVADAEEAIRHLTNGARPDLVITDLLLPGASGLELAREIMRLAPGTPVIVTSGITQPDLTREPGVTTFLEKPFELQSLDDAIRSALALRGGSSPPG